jgi:NitT/TauT family transport system substrate-binding protein
MIETTKRVSRRLVLKGAAGVPLAVLAAPAIARSLRKVTLVYAVQTIDSTADGFFGSLPIGLGFYADEGLDVEIQTVAGAAAAVNLLANGRAEFTTHGTAGLFTGVDKGVPMKGFISQIPDYFLSIGVDRNGPIQRLEDLKGKTFGVPATSGSPMIVTKAVLKLQGWDPDKDAEFLAVGTGVPALDAFRRGRVQALVAFDSVFALFEFNGGDFRYFRPPPMPSLGFTHTTNTLIATLRREPQIALGLGRAMAKSLVYMAAAPTEELTKLHYKVFPASRSSSMSDADVFRLDALRQKARLAFMRPRQRVFEHTEMLGDATDDEIEAQRDLLRLGGEIQNPQPPDAYFTRQFIEEYNRIDIPTLIAQAKALRV